MACPVVRTLGFSYFPPRLWNLASRGTKVSSPIWHLLLFSGRGGWWWVGRRCAKLGVMWFFPFYVHFLSDNKSLCAGRDLGNYSQEFLNPLLSP